MNFLSKLRTLEPEFCAAIEQRSRSLGLSRLESSHRIRFRGALGFSLFWIYEKDERILFAAHTAIDGNRSHTKKSYPFVAAYQSHILAAIDGIGEIYVAAKTSLKPQAPQKPSPPSDADFWKACCMAIARRFRQQPHKPFATDEQTKEICRQEGERVQICLRALIDEMLVFVSPNQQKNIRLLSCYAFDNTATLRSIGAAHNISGECVRHSVLQSTKSIRRSLPYALRDQHPTITLLAEQITHALAAVDYDLASLALFGWPEMDAVRTLHLCRIFLDIDELKDTYVVALIKASKK